MGDTIIKLTNLGAFHQCPQIEMINVMGQVLDAFLLMYFMHRFFREKKPDQGKYWIAAGCGMMMALWMGDFFTGNNFWVWLALMLLCPFVYTLLFCEGSWEMKLLMGSMPFTILIALEYVGVSVIYLISEMGLLTFERLWLFYLFRRILLKALLALAIRFLLRCTVRESNMELKKYWYTIGGVCTVEIGVLLAVRKHTGESAKALVLHLLLEIFCVIFPILVYYVTCLLNNDVKRVQTEMYQRNFIETQDQYMNQILAMQEDMRQFRHDYKSHLFCIDGLVQEENYTELHAYLKDLHGIRDQQEEFIRYTRDSRLNIILNQKRELAAKRGVSWSIAVRNAELQWISFYDLNMLLSNLCDNAIEAAQGSEEKWVELALEKERAYLRISIKNSAAGNPEKENPQFLTSKQNKELHGCGMQIIRNVVEKYEGLLETEGGEGWLEINILLMDEEGK